MSGLDLKRKAACVQAPEVKRARINPASIEDSDISGSDFEYDQSGFSSSTEKEGSPSNESTPLTPLSSRPSPRFPSQLKNIHCSFQGCDKTFNRPANLTQHLRSHTNTRLYKCPHASCPKDFLRESHLKHHLKSQHSDVRDFMCDWDGCGKSFVTGTRMRRHRAAHEGKEQFRCVIEPCGQVFRKHGTLQKHIIIVHEGKSPFICRVLDDRGEECGAGFDVAGKLKSHEGRIHGGKRFWCTVCSSAPIPRETDLGQEGTKDGFSTYTELQDHISVKHAPTCETCGLQCKSQRALKSHIDIVHGPLGVDERRKFACDESGCGRTFTKRGNLNVHVRTVHAEKRFVCGGTDLSSLKNVAEWDGLNACGQAMSTKQSLEGHIRTAHLGLPHSRKKTDTSLAERKTRKKPISTLVRLTGAGYENESGRDISCLLPDCSFRFIRDYDLEVHLTFHHGLSNNQMESLRSGSETLVSRLAWDGSLVSEDFETEHALDMQFNNESGMEGIQATCQEGSMKRLDLGADHVKEANMEGFQGQADQDIDMLDPMLR